MEPKLHFIIVCDKAEFQDSGKFNVVGGFNKISAKGVPALISGVFVLAEAEMSAGKHTARLVFREKNSNENNPIEGTDNINKPIEGFHRTIFEINNLLIKNEGKYVFDYFLDENKIGESAEIEFTIN